MFDIVILQLSFDESASLRRILNQALGNPGGEPLTEADLENAREALVRIESQEVDLYDFVVDSDSTISDYFGDPEAFTFSDTVNP